MRSGAQARIAKSGVSLLTKSSTSSSLQRAGHGNLTETVCCGHVSRRPGISPQIRGPIHVGRVSRVHSGPKKKLVANLQAAFMQAVLTCNVQTCVFVTQNLPAKSLRVCLGRFEEAGPTESPLSIFPKIRSRCIGSWDIGPNQTPLQMLHEWRTCPQTDRLSCLAPKHAQRSVDHPVQSVTEEGR